MTCAFIPPTLLERLAAGDDPALRARARRTLELDAVHRSERARRMAPHPPSPPAAPEPQRTVFDAGSTTDMPGTVARAEGEPETGDAGVDEEYRWLGASYQFYQQVYGRNSIDGAGLPLHATVHYGQDYTNAFWTGQQLVFGDGDGRVFGRFTRPLSITAHEITHGVIQHSSALGYNDQAGALNESLSDVFSSLVKQHDAEQTAAEADWLVGENLFLPEINAVALRSLAEPGTAYDDPLIGKDPQPATMAGYVETAEDNGGVHTNSGIPNHAFYLVARELGGNAWERAGQVWYDTLTSGEMTENADFGVFARLTVEAANRRYGRSSPEAGAVRRGWSRVGVDT